MTINSLNNLFI